MDRERFNTLLLDPSQVTNADIKALNEYRKKYPYFQSLYVVIAKALKDREHPKTDAFIKKAAIYSANRSYLKSIIEGDYTFPEKTEPAKTSSKPDKEKTEATKEFESVPSPVEIEVKEKTDNQEQQPKLAVNPEKEKTRETAPKGSSSSKEPKASEEVQTKKVDLNDDLEEIRAAKKRIEALLAGEQIEEVSKKKSTKKKKSTSPSQVEIIEKFIQNEPQIERQKISERESKSAQEDLASKKIKGAEEFETETLARLMVKQGKYKKAISIYKKLSLKFPEKSTYFAGQIEEVKSKQNV